MKHSFDQRVLWVRSFKPPPPQWAFRGHRQRCHSTMIVPGAPDTYCMYTHTLRPLTPRIAGALNYFRHVFWKACGRHFLQFLHFSSTPLPQRTSWSSLRLSDRSMRRCWSDRLRLRATQWKIESDRGQIRCRHSLCSWTGIVSASAQSLLRSK